MSFWDLYKAMKIQKIPRLAFKITRVNGEITELQRKYSSFVSISSEERILYLLSDLVKKLDEKLD